MLCVFFANAEEQAAFRVNQKANERIIFRRNAARTIRKLLNAGYKDSISLSAVLLDLEQNPTPIAERVGRGYSA